MCTWIENSRYMRAASVVSGGWIGGRIRIRPPQFVTDDAVINWTLQLGAFGTRAEAEKLASEVRERGHAAKLEARVVPGLGTRHQVRVGLYDTYNEAQEALRRIEKELDVVGITVPVDLPIVN